LDINQIFLLFFVLLFSIGFLYFYRNRHPKVIGLINGRLAPCPFTPNCVCSECQDATHAIAPFKVLEDARGNPIETLATVIQHYPRAKIITHKKHYLHAEFRSKLFGFVDDVEFSLHLQEEVVHLRSASRFGYSDLGVNRKRAEHLRRDYQKMRNFGFKKATGLNDHK